MYKTKEENKEKIEWFDSLPSTNDYAKAKREEGQNRIVVAKSQTGGRGTKGRSFSSHEGGVYLSKLVFPQNLAAKNAFRIMQDAAVAVCETLRRYHVNAVIKWPNDVYVSDKKICGILIENALSGGKVHSSVVGIGLNVQNKLPNELCSIATTMSIETGRTFCLREVTRTLIEELRIPRDASTYAAYVGYLGKEVTLLFQDGLALGKMLAVDDEGGLIVQIEGQTRRLTSGEVSLRIEKEKEKEKE